MAGRPEILWPLFADLTALRGVGPRLSELFAKLDIRTPRDLLTHAPFRLVDRRLRATLKDAPEDEIATVEAMIGAHYPARDRRGPSRIAARDAEIEFMLVFFNVKPERLATLAPEGATRVISGRVERYDGVLQIVQPEHVLAPAEAAALPDFEPVYPVTKGLSQKVVARAAQAAIDLAPTPPEWLDPAFFAKRGLPSWREAVQALHSPSGPDDLELRAPPRARLAYDELLSHHLIVALARAKLRKGKGRPTVGDGALRRAVLEAAPFAPTGAQTRSIAEIEADLAAPERMNRLLQGDVGAGKTFVALMAMLIAVEAGGQAALMAPTELLARQHLRALRGLIGEAGPRVEMLSGRDKGAAREEKLAALATGETDILVGTHALFQKGVAFHDLRLAIIDEQHRFGVRQRMELAEKGAGADILVMTATPIPRTLALAGYGDMDVSLLDEKPPGRQPIDTRIAPVERYQEVVARLKAALAEGRRAYWVCPLVEGSDMSDLTAAEERFAALRAVFGDAARLVHGQMPAAERDAAMADFASGAAQLLVATTVIEVGVDVPEASIMVIERAESFGLAQLHQLRGRVGRGAERSTCLLLYADAGETARARLRSLRDTEDGFRLAEEDLRLRGMGDLIGAKQSGLPRMRIADLERQVREAEIARDDARLVLARDPDLTSERGRALRLLLWLHGRDEAVRMLRAG